MILKNYAPSSSFARASSTSSTTSSSSSSSTSMTVPAAMHGESGNVRGEDERRSVSESESDESESESVLGGEFEPVELLTVPDSLERVRGGEEGCGAFALRLAAIVTFLPGMMRCESC